MEQEKIITSKYFYGVEIPQEEIKRHWLSYGTMVKAFDCVMVNNIDKLFYGEINGEYVELQQIHGQIDNSEEIEEIEEKLDTLQEQLEEIEEIESEEIEEEIAKLEEEKKELEEEERESQEIYQYFIIDNNGVDIIQECTNDPIFYIDYLDCYVWGVTHFGTSWDYVSTNAYIDLNAEQLENDIETYIEDLIDYNIDYANFDTPEQVEQELVKYCLANEDLGDGYWDREYIIKDYIHNMTINSYEICEDLIKESKEDRNAKNN